MHKIWQAALLLPTLSWIIKAADNRFLENPRCTYPNGEQGFCVPIEDCPPAKEISSHRDKKVVEEILKKFLCDYRSERETKVCCSRSDIQRQQPGLRITTRAPSLERTTNGGDAIRYTQSTTTPPPMSRRTTTTEQLQTRPPLRRTTTEEPFFIPELEMDIPIARNYSQLPSSSVCGKPDPHQYSVVGRKNAAYGSWPWMAALGYQSIYGRHYVDYLYAGTLISHKYVLTAARCVFDRKPVTVRLGVLNLHEHDPYRVDVPVNNVRVHEDYNPSTLLNNIAIIELKHPVIFSDLIKPICLPTSQKMKTKDYDERDLRVAGWGTIYSHESSTLKEAVVPVVPEEDCRRVYDSVHESNVDSKVICAGHLDGGIDACRGDYGGPLMDRDNPKEVYLVGIVSYGARCVMPGFPGVFTKVSSYMDWIVNQLG